MTLLRRAALAALFAFACQLPAQALVLPSGLALDPDDSLALTYQVVPQYDEHEKVIAGWLNEKLQYMIVVERLPPGYLDAERYLQLLVHDLRSQGRKVEPGRYGQYKTDAGLAGRYLEFASRGSAKDAPTAQIAYHLSDGKLAFFAVVTTVGDAPADRVLDETRRLFQTASLPANAPPLPVVGDWAFAGTAPDGRPATATLAVKDDRTFASEVRIGDEFVLRASGHWSASDRRITWTYEKSDPPLPANLREDEDEIVSIDDKRWVLRSRLSGKERELLRR